MKIIRNKLCAVNYYLTGTGIGNTAKEIALSMRQQISGRVFLMTFSYFLLYSIVSYYVLTLMLYRHGLLNALYKKYACALEGNPSFQWEFSTIRYP